jgi:hypothetical protein
VVEILRNDLIHLPMYYRMSNISSTLLHCGSSLSIPP